MRTYWRQRNDLVQSAGRHILRMQKALTQMNVQLANVLSRYQRCHRTGHHQGHSWLANVIRMGWLSFGIVESRRARNADRALIWRATGKKICCSFWKQEQEAYEFASSRSQSVIASSAQYLQQREDRSQGAPLPEEKRKGRLKKKRANKPQFDLREGLFRMNEYRLDPDRQHRRHDRDDGP